MSTQGLRAQMPKQSHQDVAHDRSGEHGFEQRIEMVPDRHHGLARRDFTDVEHLLSGLGHEAFDDARSKCSPHQTFCDRRLCRAKAVQITVRLPFLEEQLYLPPQSIDLVEIRGWETVAI